MTETINQQEVAPAELAPADDTNTKSWFSYVFIGLLVVALVILMYYAYCRFIDNSTEEPMSKGVEQERDDPIVDFNLREAIRELQSTLSENMDI